VAADRIKHLDEPRVGHPWQSFRRYENRLRRRAIILRTHTKHTHASVFSTAECL